MLIKTRRFELELGVLMLYLRAGGFEMYWNSLRA